MANEAVETGPQREPEERCGCLASAALPSAQKCSKDAVLGVEVAACSVEEPKQRRDAVEGAQRSVAGAQCVDIPFGVLRLDAALKAGLERVPRAAHGRPPFRAGVKRSQGPPIPATGVKRSGQSLKFSRVSYSYKSRARALHWWSAGALSFLHGEHRDLPARGTRTVEMALERALEHGVGAAAP